MNEIVGLWPTQYFVLQGNGLPRQRARWLAMTVENELFAAELVLRVTKPCHCEPVTYVTGVAIRFPASVRMPMPARAFFLCSETYRYPLKTYSHFMSPISLRQG